MNELLLHTIPALTVAWAFVYLLLGMGAVTLGAERFVKGAASLARGFGIRPLVIGLTLVAFGTSAPELFVSATAAWQRESGIAVGNVVGSNITNIALALGLAALIRPLKVDRSVITTTFPFLLAVSLVFAALSVTDLGLSRVEGVIFTVLLAIFLWLCFKTGAKPEHLPEIRGGRGLNMLWTLLGLAILMVGSFWFVEAAKFLAISYGVSTFVVGATIVAVGTSLPELAVSITAQFKGEDDISVGNVLGSNVFNTLAVLGVAALIFPLAVTVTEITVFIPLMVAVTVLLGPMLWTGGRVVSRKEGAVLVLLWVVFNIFSYSGELLGRPLPEEARDSLLGMAPAGFLSDP